MSVVASRLAQCRDEKVGRPSHRLPRRAGNGLNMGDEILAIDDYRVEAGSGPTD